MASHATHEHAQLLLQLYDLRREKRLRQARDFVGRDCKFKDFKDFQKRYPDGSKESNYVGMVVGYWEMACALVARGLIAEELFSATNFEHVAVWFKLRPVIEAWRKQFHYPDLMKNLETVATRHPAAASMEPQPSGKNKSGPKARKAAAKPAAEPAPTVDLDDEEEDD